MIAIGLTGSIGMGKTTVASQLAALGAKTCSADAIVHALMDKGGLAVEKVGKVFPGVVKAGVVDRKALGEAVFKDKKKRAMLEDILHPLVIEVENRFIEKQRRLGAKIVVIDIPLLYETGGDKRFDLSIVVSAPQFLQKHRVMRRAGMSEEKFRRIVTSQMHDREKRQRADAVVLTGLGRAYSFRQLVSLIKALHA